MLTVVDLFAGLGGNSEGARQAGFTVVAAANHWPVAVEYHRQNHPDAEHYCQDLQQANFHEWPDFDVMMASPACQGHSAARGKERPHHDATRSTAWAVVACAEAKHPKAFFVENVPDFLRWRLFPLWRACLESLGYLLHVNLLDAADLGVPQHRRRVFITGVRRDVSRESIIVPAGNATHRPAQSILDGDATNWSPISRPGRATATLERIENGRRTHGDRFLMAYYGHEKGGRSLDRPIGTITTRARYALVEGDRMRMLTAKEVLRAQGFREDYRLPNDHATALTLIGNGVPPTMAKHVLLSLKAAVAA